MNLHSYPFPSQRMPLIASNGIVATSQPLAAQAGLMMLQKGGNAVDAAIATAVALTVLEPTSNGIGGDAFALVWDGERLHGLNASGRAPVALDAADLRAQGYTKMPKDGWIPVMVPGAPGAWGDLHERFGRLSLDDVMAPAIAYASQGHGVSPIVAYYWAKSAERFLKSKDPVMAHWMDTFTKNGQSPKAGERWVAPEQAETLRTLAKKGVRDFYEGEIADKIATFSRATGGLLSADDLAKHQSTWVEPIHTEYRGHEIWEIPPNGQGLTALIALAILEGTDVSNHAHGSVESLHLQIEAMKLAFADARRYIADPEKVDVPVKGLLDPAYIASRRALIGERARQPEAGIPPRSGTIYLCAADRDGMMVSYIQSNYMGFGSGIVVPGTGIALQNRGECFSLEEGHLNEAAGGKRSYHTIIPSFLSKGGQPIGPFGVMGGYMQPQGHTQVALSTIDHHLNPQAALDAPRWQVTGGLGVSLESGFSQETQQALAARGHDVRMEETGGYFGRGQIIWRLDDGVMVAGSDLRADGAAVGW